MHVLIIDILSYQHFIKIEYADHKDKRFKEFIELLAKDSGISLYEE